MWTLHHPMDCKEGKAPTGTSTKAHIAAFDTVDSDLDMECRLRQSQSTSWLWLAMTNHILWLLLPFDMGLALHAFGVCTVIVLLLLTEAHAPEEPKVYVPKKQRPPESWWIKASLHASNRFLDAVEKMIMNIKTRRRYRPRQPRTCGRCTRQKKQRSVAFTQVINMTSTWSNQWPAPRVHARQFDSDSYKLMLDDGASACITNCKEDFVEPPQARGPEGKRKKGSR